MSGKSRPSLREKTLYNVERCNLSNTDKKCIKKVFETFEKQQAELEDLFYKLDGVMHQYIDSYEENEVLKAEIDNLNKKIKQIYKNYFACIKDGKVIGYVKFEFEKAEAKAVKEFVKKLEPLKKFRSCVNESEYELSVTMREIDNLLKERVNNGL